MGIPDGAHTHGSGGSGLGTALLVLAGAALAVKLAAHAAAAVGELVHVLLVVVAIVAGVAAAALLGLCAWRLYRWRHPGAAHTTTLPPAVTRASGPSRRHSGRSSSGRANCTCTCTGSRPRMSPPSSTSRHAMSEIDRRLRRRRWRLGPSSPPHTLPMVSRIAALVMLT
jgi:hypothetical protein